MADKRLTQLVGGEAKEIGDRIYTEATALTDGRVLVDCDGSVITPTTYPLLEALLPNSVVMSEPYVVEASNGNTIADIVGTQVVRGSKLGVSNSGAYLCGSLDSHVLYYQNLATAAQAVSATVAYGNSCVSDDGLIMLTAQSNAAGSSDLLVRYTLDASSTPPSASRTIESTDNMTAGAVTMMNADGSSAKIVCHNNSDLRLDTYNSGADVGAAYTLHAAYAYSNSPTSAIDWSWSDDLNTLAVCYTGTTDGLWISSNGGTTWTEDVVINGLQPRSCAVDNSDVVYALAPSLAGRGGQEIYRTTDFGANMTLSLNAAEARNALKQHGLSKVNFLKLFGGAGTSDVYCIGYAVVGAWTRNTGGHPLEHLCIWYSDDSGVTWSGQVVDFGLDPFFANSNESWTETTGFAMSPDRSVLVITVETATEYAMRWFDLSTGLALPFLPGYKIVADRP